jgi:hypothetical protein
MTNKQVKKADGRYEGTNYRYSDTFIRKMTNWLIAYIFIGTGLGFGIGAMGDVFFAHTNTPTWYTVLAVTIMASGVGLPLLVSAWLGASALNKYAGPVGLLLCAGIGALAYGQVVKGQSMWIWIGATALVVSVGLFFLIGFRAKVAMWLQLPILNSPRLYISKGKGSNDKKTTAKKK